MTSYSVIITAGGIGKRMGANIPKQFMLLNERPLLMYTIQKFYEFDPNCQLILTLPEDWMSYWEELLQEYDFRIPHRIISGGKERYDSIKNALEFCNGDYILVHDGVRPLVSLETIQNCIDGLMVHKAVIPVLPVKESLRKIEGDGTKAVNRDAYIIVQTPQCFESGVLRTAYQQDFHAGITDDATLVEQLGQRVHTVEGNEENIKVTTKADLIFSELMLR